jgi:hypothetical protein
MARFKVSKDPRFNNIYDFKKKVLRFLWVPDGFICASSEKEAVEEYLKHKQKRVWKDV